MAKDSILSKFFSSGIQALSVQVLGIFLFYLISLFVSKEDFGAISWVNALCMLITTLLSCGLEQVIVRRIAVSTTSDWAAAAFFFHSFIGSAIVFLVIVAIHSLYKTVPVFSYLPLFFLAQSVIYITTPFKQFLNAKEIFVPYGIIALISNLGKLVSFFLLTRFGEVSINKIAWILIASAVFELFSLLIYILTSSSFKFTFKYKFTAYQKLLKEALPQYVSVIFDSGLSRLDWILLGLISTSVITADYSFAYRAFEIARLPIAIIAPVILPYFARTLFVNGKFDNTKAPLIKYLFIIEVFFAVLMILCLNILWTPVVSYITQGKYGAANSVQFFILSLCLPFQFFINLLWTISFAGRKYKLISVVTIISASSNLVLNLIFIPLYAGFGAAFAFLITCIIQVSGYYFIVKKECTNFPAKNAVLFFLFGYFGYFLSGILSNVIVIRLILAILIYVGTCIMFRQFDKTHLKTFVLLFKR